MNDSVVQKKRSYYENEKQRTFQIRTNDFENYRTEQTISGVG